MGQQRRSFTPEFKQEAVDLCRRSGKSACQVARELGIPQPTFNQWMRQVAGAPLGSNSFLATEELKALHREVKQLRMERNILKKPWQVQAVRATPASNTATMWHIERPRPRLAAASAWQTIKIDDHRTHPRKATQIPGTKTSDRMPLILLKAHRGEAGIYETMDSADALSKTIWRKC